MMPGGTVIAVSKSIFGFEFEFDFEFEFRVKVRVVFELGMSEEG